MPTNALHALTKNGGGGSFKLRHRRSSKDHTHQILLTRSNSTPPNATPSPTSPLTPPTSPTPLQLAPAFPNGAALSPGSSTPQSGGTLKRGSRAGSLTSIPETAALQEALQEAAQQLSKKSEYAHPHNHAATASAPSTMTRTQAMMMSASLSSSSSLFTESGGGAVVTVLEGGEEVVRFVSSRIFSGPGDRLGWSGSAESLWGCLVRS